MNRLLSIMLVSIGWLALPLLAWGQPQVPKGVAGYTVTIQDEWVKGQQGFAPIRVTVKTNPVRNVVNDLRFTVSVNKRVYQYSPSVVMAPLVIPAGRNSAAVELYVDLADSGNVYGLKVLVEQGEYDGRLDRGDLLMTETSPKSYYGQVPGLLYVSSAFTNAERSFVCYQGKMQESGGTKNSFVSNDPVPRIDELSNLYLGPEVISANGGNPTASPSSSPALVVANSERIHGIHPSGLPQNWIGYSSVDQILISMSDFKSICLNQGADRSRIEQWVTAGGCLIVFDTGPAFQEADKIWPFLLGPDRAPIVDRELSQWTVPDAKTKRLSQILPRPHARGQGYYYDQDQTAWFDPDGREVVESANNVQRWQTFAKPSLIPALDPPSQNNAKPNSDSGNRFAISRYMNGIIVAVNDDLSTWTKSDWRGLQNSIVSMGDDMGLKIGYSTGMVEMPGFAIPGVGEPPIKMFQILIGLFLLLAGPIMLLVLKRTGQMQYLFVAVPVLSLSVCVSLFLYAVIADGSNRWGRTQTVTSLDHRTNMAVTHSRTNYYSGANPGRYGFPAQTMSMVALEGVGNPLYSRFESDQQKVWGGNLRPRMPHEVVSIRSHSTRQRLILIPPTSDAEGNLPAIKNQLGADVELVLFRTDKGLFMVENIASEQTQVATKVSESLAKAKCRAKIQDLSPDVDRGFSRQRNRRVYYGPGPSSERNRFGEDARVVEMLRNNRGEDLIRRPMSYLAILKQFPLAEEQIEPVEYKLEVHVVRGQW